MTATLIAVLVCLPSLASQPERASVVFYSPGVFERVVKVRQRQGYHLPRSEGWAAVPQCSRIGEVITVQVRGRSARVTVADCSRPRDRARHLRVNQVELDYQTAKRLGVVRAGRVRGWVWQ